MMLGGHRDGHQFPQHSLVQDQLLVLQQPSPPSPQQWDHLLPSTRRWSCDNTASIDAEGPAYPYHNLDLPKHNHMYMSNQKLADPDIASSAPIGSKNENCSFTGGEQQLSNIPAVDSPNRVPETVRPQRFEMRHQSNSLHHHHPYELEMYDGNYFENSARSVSAPSVGIQGCPNVSGNVTSGAVPVAPISSGLDYGARRRFRTNFTEAQSLFLEDSFRESHYPDHKSKKDMAAFLNIPEDRITVWFQNRRAKWRRKELREKERSNSDGYTPSCSFDYTCYPGGFSAPSPMMQPPMTSLGGFPDHQVQMQPSFEIKPNSVENHSYFNDISDNTAHRTS